MKAEKNINSYWLTAYYGIMSYIATASNQMGFSNSTNGQEDIFSPFQESKAQSDFVF